MLSTLCWNSQHISPELASQQVMGSQDLLPLHHYLAGQMGLTASLVVSQVGPGSAGARSDKAGEQRQEGDSGECADAAEGADADDGPWGGQHVHPNHIMIPLDSETKNVLGEPPCVPAFPASKEGCDIGAARLALPESQSSSCR